MKFILTADWHLRGERPRCRTDEDWTHTQRQTIREIVALAKTNDCPLYIVGDIFHTARTATEVVNAAIEELLALGTGRVKLLAGNHDLPYHSYDNLKASSLGTLTQIFEEITPTDEIDAAPFGQDKPTGKPLAFVHRLTMPQEHKELAELAGADSPETLAVEFPDARWIFTGDYHHAFDEEITREDGSKVRVVNPGCITVQVADMIDYRPRVYLVDTDAETVEPLYLSAPSDEFAVEYLEAEKARESRADAFFEAFKGEARSLSFRDNLEVALTTEEALGDAGRGVVLEVMDEVYGEERR